VTAVTSPATDAPRPAGALSIALAVADDALLGRLKRILTRGGYIVTRSAPDFRALIASGAPLGMDAVLLDARGRRAAEIRSEVRDAKGQLGAARLILICSAPGRAASGAAVRAGADAVLAEPHIESALVAALRAACADQVVISAPLARGTLHTGALTHREKQILGMVVMGFSNRQISRKLCLAESTVKGHLSSAFGKLDVNSRTEAASLILDPDQGVGAGILAISGPDRSG
jgi:DNA-binding NarL/FixJ family response regulator